MSDCNVNEIMAEAGCWACLPPDQLEIIQTELLCRIYTNGGGGGGTPGGSDGQVQFNDAGAFGGDAGLTYDKTTNVLTAGGVAITGMTAGSVLFSGAAGAIAQDNANFFFNDATNALLVTGSVSTPSLISTGAITVTPGAGTNLNIALSTTGDLVVNTNQLYVDTSSGFVGIGETGASITSRLFIKNAAAGDIGQIIKLAAVPTGDAFRVTSSADAVLMRITSAGSILAPFGTAAAPGIAFEGDATTGFLRNAGGGVRFISAGTPSIGFGTNLRLTSGASLIWVDTGDLSTGTDDLILTRDGANILAQKNAAAAQAFRIYGTTVGPLYLSMSHDGTNGIIDVNTATQLRIGATASAVAIDSPLMVGGVAAINQVSKILQGSDTNDFASVAAGTESAVKTLTITGAVEGDPVFIGLVNGAGSPNIGWTAWVSAANTVSYKFYNRNTVAAVDLGSLVYKFFVHQL